MMHDATPPFSGNKFPGRLLPRASASPGVGFPGRRLKVSTMPRLIRIIAFVLALAGVAASGALVPWVNAQRRGLRWNSADAGAAAREPQGAVEVFSTALGSFSGLLINVLWYRAEQQKQEDKFWEANDTAELITKLQPRFPAVWTFQAWNMAYNISVATFTQEERYYWVNKGISLLRDEGIPYNPDAIQLYKELGWIFIHKIGGNSDDAHWYYKRRMAQEWQEVLGNVTAGATQERAVENFRPVADAGDRYFLHDRPPRDVREGIMALVGRGLLTPEAAGRLREAPVGAVAERLEAMTTGAAGANRALSDAVEPLRARARAQADALAREPLTRLMEDVPATRRAVEMLREQGHDVDTLTLRLLGRAIDVAGLFGEEAVLQRREATVSEPVQRLYAAWRGLPDEATGPLLAFMRARALVRDYHMDPGFMLQLMQEYGPLDWRHPASHAAYWSELGIERSGQLRSLAGIDTLNTERQVIHAMQLLFNEGQIVRNPLALADAADLPAVDYLPDPRFAKFYERAFEAAIERERQGLINRDVEQTFGAGYENFLLRAMLYAYLYGNEAEARYFYDKAKVRYADLLENKVSGRYNLSLDDLVMQEAMEATGLRQAVRAFVSSMLQNALRQGLASGRPDRHERFVRVAIAAHEEYNKTFTNDQATMTQQRTKLPPMQVLYLNEAFGYLQNPAVDLRLRGMVYRELADWAKPPIYQRLIPILRQQAEGTPAAGLLDPLFPPPLLVQEPPTN